MKLTYKAQMMIAVVLIILGNVLTDVFDSWIYRSAGFIVCGFMWIIHPVLPNRVEATKRTLLGLKIAGAVLILIGIFTRAHY